MSELTLLALNSSLTPTEADILEYLMDHPDRLVTPEELYAQIWKEEPYMCHGVIAVHIHNLRQKLAGEKHSIHCIRNRGYRYQVRSEVNC